MWPPVPEEECKVLRKWTSCLASPKCNLKSIRILYLDDHVAYSKPRWWLAWDRYITLLMRGPLPSCFEGKDIYAMRDSGEMISEEELYWEKTRVGWSCDVKDFI